LEDFGDKKTKNTKQKIKISKLQDYFMNFYNLYIKKIVFFDPRLNMLNFFANFRLRYAKDMLNARWLTHIIFACTFDVNFPFSSSNGHGILYI
jgi:hypothetical protein